MSAKYTRDCQKQRQGNAYIKLKGQVLYLTYTGALIRMCTVSAESTRKAHEAATHRERAFR